MSYLVSLRLSPRRAGLKRGAAPRSSSKIRSRSSAAFSKASSFDACCIFRRSSLISPGVVPDQSAGIFSQIFSSSSAATVAAIRPRTGDRAQCNPVFPVISQLLLAAPFVSSMARRIGGVTLGIHDHPAGTVPGGPTIVWMRSGRNGKPSLCIEDRHQRDPAGRAPPGRLIPMRTSNSPRRSP